MATRVASLYADVEVRTDKATKDLKHFDGSIKSTFQNIDGGVKSLAKMAGGLAAMGAAVKAGQAVLDFSKESIRLFGIQEKAEAQLAATIKSTGSAAGVTANELKDYASALQSATTFGDEAIIGAQSLLLTFTNIGGPVMKDATKTVLDMSQALGQDLKSSSIQIGKALNDPIQGLTALSRVGVSFTEQQKQQIRVMQEAGDVAGAQQLILAELNKEFGGSAQAAADTYAGKIEQLSNNYGDLQEQIGATLAANDGFIDSLNKLVSGLTSAIANDRKLSEAMEAGWISQEKFNDVLRDAENAGKSYEEIVADLVSQYKEFEDAQIAAVIVAEDFDRVLTGTIPTYEEATAASRLITDEFLAQKAAAGEARFANSELADKVQQLGHHMSVNEALVYNANNALRDHGAAASEVQGPMGGAISLTERINAEIERLNNQPKDFKFNMNVSGLESLREAVRLAGQIGGGNDQPDPFAGGGDRPDAQARFDRPSDQTFGTSKPVGGGIPTQTGFANGVTNYIVPPGFSNDSFIMGVSSGEVVNVSNGRNGGMGGNIYNIDARGASDPAAVRRAVESVMRQYGARSETYSRM